jgi:transposase
MEFCYFVGIDIAKDTLDWAVCTQQGITFNTHTDNTIAGIKIALT